MMNNNDTDLKILDKPLDKQKINKSVVSSDDVLDVKTVRLNGRDVAIATKRDKNGRKYQEWTINGKVYTKKINFGSSVLDVNPDHLDSNFYYRWVNSSKVDSLESAGYEVVSDKNITTHIEASKTVGSQKQVLMRIPQEIREFSAIEAENKRKKQLEALQRHPQGDGGDLPKNFFGSQDTRFSDKKQRIEDFE